MNRTPAVCLLTIAIGIAAAIPSLDAAFPTNLNQYTLVTQISSLTNPLGALDFSGVAYNTDTQTLFVVENGTERIHEYTTAGGYLRSITLTGFDDTEGIVYMGGGVFAVIEEGLKDITRLSIGPSTTTLVKSVGVVINPTITGTFGNSGFEDLAYDSTNNRFYVLKEKTTTADGTVVKGVYQVANPAGGGPAATVQLSAVTASLTASDLSGDFFNNLPGGHLYVQSHEANNVVEVALDGTLTGSAFALPSGTHQFEGITFSPHGMDMFILGEPREFLRYSTAKFKFNATAALTLNALKGAAASPTVTAQIDNFGIVPGTADLSATGAATVSPAATGSVAGGANTIVTIGTNLSLASYGSGTGTVTVGPNIASSETLAVNVIIGGATAASSGANNLNAFDPLNALTAPVAGSGSYAGLASKTTAGGAIVGTEAIIRQGRNAVGSANENVTMNWRTRANVETFPTATTPPIDYLDMPVGLISDVVKLTGISHSSGATSGDRVRTDPFTLQMSYNPALLQGNESLLAQVGRIHLVWLDTNYDGTSGAAATDLWKLATLGNFTAGTTVIANYLGDNDGAGTLYTAGSWDSFVADYGASDVNLATFVGSYGVDTTNHVVWAVLDHNSQFSVVPEPSALGLFGVGGLGLISLVRGRRTS